MQRRAVAAVFGFASVLVLTAVVLQSGLWVEVVGTGDYEEGTVTVRDGTTETATSETTGATATEATGTTVAVRNEGEVLGTVHVRIADTFEKRYVGLSDTESLAADEGMLFVHDEDGSHTYVMRDMDFELDMIFIAANGTVTTIHHASLPPEGTSESELTRYEGRGKYVLEVNRGWVNRTGVTVGDRVVLPAGVR